MSTKPAVRTPRPDSSIPHPTSKRGGKRPGAGAPRGNLNGLKSGRYSKQVKALKLALQAVPLTADVFRRLDKAGEGKRALMARALQHYAELLLLDPATLSLVQDSNQSINRAVPDLGQLRKDLGFDESNQAIKEANE